MSGAAFAPAPVAAPDDFRPAAWLDAFASIGGRYALVAERRLWLCVEHCDGEDLAVVMAHMIGRRDRQEAVKQAIEQRQNGEAV